MSERIDITILNRKNNAANRKTAAIPGKRRSSLSRRRGGFNVTLYDLAQVNTGTAESPVWDDHPIIFQPAYTYSYPTYPAEIPTYTFTEEFTDTEYATYVNLFTQHDVTEWDTRFRKLIKYNVDGDQSAGAFHLAWMGDIELMSKPYITPPRTLAGDVPTYRNILDTSTPNTSGFQWTTNSVRYYGGGRVQDNFSTGWYPCISAREYLTYVGSPVENAYKITATNDPNAARAEFPAGSGNYVPRFSSDVDLFLFPEIIFWRAYSNSGFNFTDPRYELGMHFQITPRKMFPNLIEPLWDDGGTLVMSDPNGRKAAFMAYQASRSGIRCSRTNSNAAYGPGQSGSETMVAASEFPQDYWIAFTDSYLSNSAPRNMSPDVGTSQIVEPITSPAVSWGQLTEPMLRGVFRYENNYYYSWRIPPVGLPFSFTGASFGAVTERWLLGLTEFDLD